MQSVALRLIVDRECEIEAFVPQEYWSVVATMEHDGTEFEARLVTFDGLKLDRLTIGDEGIGQARQGGGRSRALHGRGSRDQAAQAQPGAAVHHLDAAAGSRAQARLFGQPDDAPGAEALRGGRDHLYAHRRRADGSQRDQRRARGDHRALRRALPAREATHLQTKAKNAQEAHEAIRPTDFDRDHAGAGDEARLYELIFKRAMASQMAVAPASSARPSPARRDRRHELRATGQVVKFPGFLAIYEEGRDQKDDEEDERLLPLMRQGRYARQEGASTADQHFTQPPPRFSEASLVKRLEELGIGRPSTYASTIQTLQGSRATCGSRRTASSPRRSGRLLTAFLERFFPRYVAYDFTAGMEEELDDVSGGRAEWKHVLEAFWRDFKPKSDEVMERKPSEVTEVLDEFLSDYLFPEQADGGDPRQCPSACEGREGGRCRFAAAASARLSPARIIPSARSAEVRPAGRRRGRRGRVDRQDPATGLRSIARPAASAPTSSSARARRRAAHRFPRTCPISISNGR